MRYLCVFEQEPLVLSIVLEHHNERRPYRRLDQLGLRGGGTHGPQVDTPLLEFLRQTPGSQPRLSESPSSRLGIKFGRIDTRVQRVVGVEGQELARFSIQQQKGDQVAERRNGRIFGSYPEGDVLEDFER